MRTRSLNILNKRSSPHPGVVSQSLVLCPNNNPHLPWSSALFSCEIIPISSFISLFRIIPFLLLNCLFLLSFSLLSIVIHLYSSLPWLPLPLSSDLPKIHRERVFIFCIPTSTCIPTYISTCTSRFIVTVLLEFFFSEL